MAGRWVFAIAAICSFVGQYGFFRMARREKQAKSLADGRDPGEPSQAKETARS